MGDLTPFPGIQVARVPPCNDHAEQALLGAIMCSNQSYLRVAEFLKPEHFSNALHARIFAAAGRLIDAGQNANPVTLKAVFDVDSTLASKGGGNYLVGLASATVTLINAEHYGRLILDLAQRRALMTACDDALADAVTIDIERPAATVIEDFERRLAEIAEGRQNKSAAIPLSEALAQAVAAAEVAYKGGCPYVRTGLSDLDRLIGGLLPGDLEILAARPGMGKTACALGIALAVARSGSPVTFFSLEQPGSQLAQRLLASQAGVPVSRQQRGQLDDSEWRRLLDEETALGQLPIEIDETGAITIGQICARARRAKRRHGIGLIVIDHLQLVRAERHHEARRLDLDEISGALKALAKELAIPVLALSQLNRGVEMRDDKRPVLADLRESGGLEQDADRVMFLYREEYYALREKPEQKPGETDDKFSDRVDAHEARMRRCSGIADIHVAKDRHGPGGHTTLAWDAARMRFYDLARY